jgi:hypothetical protein
MTQSKQIFRFFGGERQKTADNVGLGGIETLPLE